MIIECINCDKKFDVNSELIPSSGRTIQCGACNHVWFFDKTSNKQNELSEDITQNKNNILAPVNNNKKAKIDSSLKTNEFLNDDLSKVDNNKNKVLPKNKINFTFFKFLSYILVLIISLIGLIIIIDTFKVILYNYFPKLEFLLFSFFETLKDIELFFKDLI